ncbi:unnamed protein product [Merluccius merluccius]
MDQICGSKPHQELGERDSPARQALQGFPLRQQSVIKQDSQPGHCYICVQDGHISWSCPAQDVSMPSAGSSDSPTQPHASLTTYGPYGASETGTQGQNPQERKNCMVGVRKTQLLSVKTKRTHNQTQEAPVTCLPKSQWLRGLGFNGDSPPHNTMTPTWNLA